jgi:hypothetical protein
MNEEQHSKQRDDFDSDGNLLMRAEPRQIPQAMGPVMTMEVVQRYVEAEHNRSRRILLWTGAMSLLVVLTVLVLFVSIGIFILRNSRKAANIAQRVQTETAHYVADVAEVSGKVSALHEGHNRIRSDIDFSEENLVRERKGLHDNLVKFSQWVAAGDNRGDEAIAAVEFRLQQMETMLNNRDKELTSLRERYGSLMASIAAGGAAVVSPPSPDAVTPESDAAETAISFAELLEDFPDVTPRGTNPVADGGETGPADAPGRTVTVMTFPNGERYEGEFKDGLFQGWGVYVFQNGDRYEGEFQADKMSGAGTMTYDNGNVYKGQFLNGVRHGKGVLTFKNGDVYDGQFKDNVRYGQGDYRFSNGSRYVGDFQNGLRHGKGRYSYPTGEEFVGYFKNGQMDGPGICTYANGKQIKGVWKTGRFVRAVDEETP